MYKLVKIVLTFFFCRNAKHSADITTRGQDISAPYNNKKLSSHTFRDRSVKESTVFYNRNVYDEGTGPGQPTEMKTTVFAVSTSMMAGS